MSSENDTSPQAEADEFGKRRRKSPALVNRLASVLHRIATIINAWDQILDNEPDSDVSASYTNDQELNERPVSLSQEDDSVGPTNYWWVYLVVLVSAALGVMALPSSLAFVLLLALIVGALGLAALDAELTPRRMWAIAVATWRTRKQLPAFVDTHRIKLTSGFAIAGCLLIVLSASGFRPSNQGTLNNAFMLMVLGFGALGVARFVSSYRSTLITPTTSPLTPARSNWAVTAAGVLILLILAETNGQALQLPFTGNIHHVLQFFLLLNGCGLIAFGLGGAPRISTRKLAFRRIGCLEAMSVLFIVGLALVLRTWQLNTSVRGSIDEVISVQGVFRIWWDDSAKLVTAPSIYLTTLVYSQWQAGVIEIVGHTLAGLRATGAIVGSLTIIPLYILARTLFDRKVAIIAAFMLATFPPHIHFSRLALIHIADPLFGTLTFAFIARGIKRNRRMDWAIAGVSLGLTQYFFEAGRLLFPPLVAGWIIIMALIEKRHLRAQWRGLVVTTLAALFVAMPVYYTIFAQDAARASRFEVSGLDSEYWEHLLDGGISGSDIQELAERVGFASQVYVHQPEIAAFYGGTQPLILGYLVPVFLLGIGYMIWRFRSPANIILLWIIVTTLGTSLMRDSAVYPRYVVVFPGVTLLMAVGIRYVPSLMWPYRNRSVLAVPLGLFVLLTGYTQCDYYFNTHLPEFRDQIREAKPYRDGFDALLRAVKLSPNTEIHFISNPLVDVNVLRPFLEFFNGNNQDMQINVELPNDITEQFISDLPSDRNLAFFLELDDMETMTFLSAFYNLGTPQYSPYASEIADHREFVLYFVSATDLVP